MDFAYNSHPQFSASLQEFSVLVRSAGQEHLEGYKLYKTVNRDFTPGEIVRQNRILC